MKLNSAWLAASLLLFAVLACNLSKNNNSNNSNNRNSNSKAISQPTRPANADVYVENISLANDENGEAGQSTTTFEPSDSKIHCVITLNKAKAGTKIKTVWIAVDVAGSKNDELKTLDYTTNSFEKNIAGYITWKGDWPKGQYRLEVYINGYLDKTIDYTVA
ncbi:MAG: hypothetical protein ABR607_00445 [Pyrinomonadaceae bacterium]